MIETEDQRRWWFATHPEYSSSRKGARKHSEEEEHDSEIDPKAVDAYVDEMLKYEDGIEAELLKILKRHFGTEGNPEKGGQGSGVSATDWLADVVLVRGVNAWERSPQNRWTKLAEAGQIHGLIVPTLPTTEEISRLSRELQRQFWGWLDALLQNNPLLMDPNALERHHGLPKEFVKYFLDCGLTIKEYLIILRLADHRLKPGGVHTGEGRGGDWNREWRQFIHKYPAKNTREHQDRVKKKLDEMAVKYGIDKKAILLPPSLKPR